MAKDKLLAQHVPFNSVAWFKDTNLGRATGDYGDEKKNKSLDESLQAHDWLAEGDGILTVEAIDAEHQKLAVEERQKQWEYLISASKSDASKNTELVVFEQLYTDKGKIVPPKFLGLTANRRGSRIFKAKVWRRAQVPPLPISEELPVIIANFSTPMERMAMQVRENQMKTTGLMEMSPEDLLVVAKKTFEYGGSESNLAAFGIKRGTAQKCWVIIQLNNRFPEIKLVERMLLPTTNSEHLPWGVDKEQLRNLRIRTDPVELAAYNQKAAGDGKEQLGAATVENVIAYLKDPKNGTTNDPPMLEKKVIKGLARQSPIRIVQACFTAVVENRTNGLVKYEPFQGGLNAIDALIDAGDGPTIDGVLVRLSKLKPDLRTIVEAELVAVLDKHNG